MNKTGKRVLIGAIIVALVGGGAGGAYYLAKSRKSTPVSVYSMNDIGMDGYWGDEKQMSGRVTADKIQSVYVSTTQIIQEIMVEEGQEVHVGDPLMSYDTTLTSLQLDSKALEVQKLELSIQKAQEELKKIQSYKPGVPVSSSGTGKKIAMQTGGESVFQTAGIQALGPKLASWFAGGSVQKSLEGLTEESQDPSAPETPAPTEPSETEPTQPTETEPTQPETPAPTQPTEPETPAPTQPTEPETPAPTQPTIPELPEADRPTFVKGTGTEQMPAIYLWKENQVISPSLLQYLLNGKEDVRVALMVRDGDQLMADGAYTEHLYTWLYEIRLEGTTPVILPVGYLMGADQDPLTIYTGDTENPDETLPGGDDIIDIDPGEPGISYTAAEIAKMRSDKELELKDLQISLQVAQVEYEKVETELNNSMVYSKIDGVVKTIGDAETAAVDNTPLITVSGGGGYYIETGIGELDLGSIQVGDSVTVQSWETYETLEGTVYSIGDFPSSDYSNYGNGNSNVSYYPLTVFVDEDANLRENEYVDVTYNSSNSEEEINSLYITSAFVRSENGKSYVMIAGENDTLEKRYISTGKNLWGSYTQIRSGLTIDDRVAFPYGKDVKEGAPVVDGDIEEFNRSFYNY